MAEDGGGDGGQLVWHNKDDDNDNIQVAQNCIYSCQKLVVQYPYSLLINLSVCRSECHDQNLNEPDPDPSVIILTTNLNKQCNAFSMSKGTFPYKYGWLP